MDWRPFTKARGFIRSLGVLDANEWCAYARGDFAALLGRRPPDIPAAPWEVYEGQGWAGLRDWLGEPPVEPRVAGFLRFKTARQFARSLGLLTAGDWRAWCRGFRPNLPARPRNVPDEPMAMYPRAWRGWADWLGRPRSVGRSSRRYLPFVRARAYVRALRLANSSEWHRFVRGLDPLGRDPPQGIPADPGRIYVAEGWQGLGDWLGTGTIAVTERTFMPYEQAREIVRGLQLAQVRDFQAWVRGDRPDLPHRPATIPANPDVAYRGRGWKGFRDFLGQSGPRMRVRRRFRSFTDARAFARTLGLLKKGEWRSYCHGGRPDLPAHPADIPRNPQTLYATTGWTSWGDFLGTGRTAPAERRFPAFAEARRFARALGLRSRAQWREMHVRGFGLPEPPDLPRHPHLAYRSSGWKGWGDFLGSRSRRHVIGRMEFEEARSFARALGLRSSHEWTAWLRGERPRLAPPPSSMPSAPEAAYRRSGWRGWGDFLGTLNLARGTCAWRAFDDARALARTLGLRHQEDWRRYLRGRTPHPGPRPDDLPTKPQKVYANSGWQGWPDFLGAGPPVVTPVPGTR